MKKLSDKELQKQIDEAREESLGSLVETGALATSIFGTRPTDGEIIDIWDFLEAAGEAGLGFDEVAGMLKSARQQAVKVFGDKVAVETVLKVYKRFYAPVVDEDADTEEE